MKDEGSVKARHVSTIYQTARFQNAKDHAMYEIPPPMKPKIWGSFCVLIGGISWAGSYKTTGEVVVCVVLCFRFLEDWVSNILDV
jgi:hypothetical protein